MKIACAALLGMLGFVCVSPVQAQNPVAPPQIVTPRSVSKTPVLPPQERARVLQRKTIDQTLRDTEAARQAARSSRSSAAPMYPGWKIILLGPK